MITPTTVARLVEVAREVTTEADYDPLDMFGDATVPVPVINRLLGALIQIDKPERTEEQQTLF